MYCMWLDCKSKHQNNEMIETLKEVVLNCDTMLTLQLFDSNKNDETIHVDENANKKNNNQTCKKAS